MDLPFINIKLISMSDSGCYGRFRDWRIVTETSKRKDAETSSQHSPPFWNQYSAQCVLTQPVLCPLSKDRNWNTPLKVKELLTVYI